MSVQIPVGWRGLNPYPHRDLNDGNPLAQKALSPQPSTSTGTIPQVPTPLQEAVDSLPNLLNAVVRSANLTGMPRSEFLLLAMMAQLLHTLTERGKIGRAHV